MSLQWLSDTSAILNGVPVRFADSDYANQRTTESEIVVLKKQQFFASYADMLKLSGDRQNILEFGIFEGGSTLILAEMFPQARIASVDTRPVNHAVLGHLTAMGFSDRVKLCYGVSQDDEASITQLVKSHLAGEIDLVSDDASHQYRLTRAAFEISFPLLIEGGSYVLEDWGWAHWRGGFFDDWQSPTMSNLVFELTMASASSPDLIHDVLVNSRFARIRRGPTKASPRLNLEDLYELGSRPWARL